MDIRKLQRTIVDGLEDVKGQNIVVFNTEHLSALFERVIIASGTSNRQTKSLASSVREAVKSAGYPVPRTEGESNGEWIIVDCGAAVVHVMQPTIRDYYHLEEIWGGKPVSMKLGSATTSLVKAAEPDAPAKKAVAKKAVAKKAVAKTGVERKAGAKKAPAAGAAARAAARTAPKAPAKTPARAPTRSPVRAPARGPVSKTVADKVAVARKVTAKKVAAPAGRVVTRVVGVKTAAAKQPAKKLPARTAAVKKAPQRKTRSGG